MRGWKLSHSTLFLAAKIGAAEVEWAESLNKNYYFSKSDCFLNAKAAPIY